jgi:hypothetical protein
VLAGRSDAALYRALPRTESLVERFGLHTIIVLRVFGVMDGLSEHDATSRRSRPG